MTFRERLRILKAFPKIFKYDWDWTWFQLKRGNLVSTKESDLAQLFVVSHVLEKGLTMPERRLGFGQSRVRMLLEMLNSYIQKYDSTPVQVQSSLNDLAEYLYIHENAHFKLPSDITDSIKAIMKYRVSSEKTTSIKCDRATYFVKNVDFEKFARSRRSLRYYSDKNVSMDDLLDALRIAQTAPSACNRQSSRVKIIQSKEAKDYVLSIHNGTRGFGHLADKILLVTSDMASWAPDDRNMAFLDAGIYTMNLLYALHFKQICACPLNAGMESKLSKELHEKLNIPASEIPVCFITIGCAPDKFMIATSERLKIEDVYTII